MNGRILFFLIFTFLLSIEASAQKKAKNTTPAPKTDERIILSVENERLSVGEFLYAYTKNNQNKSQMWEENNIREYLQLFADFKMKVLEAKAIKLDTSETFISEFEQFKEQLAKPYMTERNVTEALIQEAYSRLHEQVRASHILILVNQFAPPQDTLAAFEKIKGLRKQAMAGVDFGDLANKFSEDPSAKTNKGDLGYFTALQMVYPFENVAYKTQVGKVSEIFRTKFGYHIVKVNDRRKNEGNVKIAHLMIRANEGIPKEDSIAAVDKIFEIEKKLRKGENWEAICRQFSDDLKTRNEGGILPIYAAGTMLPEFEDAVLVLRKNEEMSQPIRTQFGWHIIKLIERTPLQSFEELKDILKEKVSRDSRAELQEERFIARLKAENMFKIKKKIEKNLLRYVDSALLKGNWKYDRNSTILSKLLFSIANENYLIGDFFIFAEANQAGNSPFDNHETYFLNLLDDYINTSLKAFEEKNLESKYPEYRYLLNEYHDGILLFEIMSRNAWQKAPSDAKGIESYFEEHRAKYRWKERLNLVVFNAADNATLDIVKQEMERGYFPVDNPNYEKLLAAPKLPKAKRGKAISIPEFSFTDLEELSDIVAKNKQYVLVVAISHTNEAENNFYKQYLEQLKAFALTKKIEADRIVLLQKEAESAGLLAKIYSRSLADLEKRINKEQPLKLQITEELLEANSNKILEKIEWKVGDYTFNEENRAFLVRVREIVPPQNKELPQVKGQVVSDYQKHLEEKMLEGLKEKYKITIYDHIIKELATKK